MQGQRTGEDTGSDRWTRRPTVAVGYGPRCVPVMQLVEAAAGVCDLVWVVDAGLPEMAQMTDLLARFGPVVDRGGLDVDAAVAAIRVHRPDAVTTLLDAGMVDLAAIAARLGLPFHPPAVAATLTDKAEQRRVLRDAGLPGPACVVVPAGPGAAAVASLVGRVPWPAILKPRSAQGSRFTFLARDATEAAALLDDLGTAAGEMVLEAYLPGDPARQSQPFADYVSVETLVCAGRVNHLAVTGRFPPAENFRETGFFIPAALDDADRDAALDVATAAIAALGVTTGCLHTEVKFTPDGPRLIEVNGRVGGGVPEMLDRAAGFPLLEWVLRVALGQPLLVDGPLACDRIGYRFFLQPPAISATVRRVDGIDAVTDHPGVDAVSLHQGPGSELDWRDGTRTHIIAVVGAARDLDELLAVDRLLHDEVSVTYSEAHH